MLDYRTHTFLAVYRSGSFTRAAEQLHVTQPAVSQHIRQIEAYYGCALFSKAGRGVEPTPAGHLLYRALDVAENDEMRLRAELGSLQGEKDERPPLRLGCTRTIADYVAPRLLAEHLGRHPDEHIYLRTGNTAELVELIEAGEIDFALVEGSFDGELFEGEVICIEPMINAGGRAVYLDRNGWAVHTADHRNSAHFELTVVVRRGRAEQLSTFDFIEKDGKIKF